MDPAEGESLAEDQVVPRGSDEAVHINGVAQTTTRLRDLASSSS